MRDGSPAGTSRKKTPAEPTGGELSRLIEVEQRLEAMLAHARQEAAQIVAQAKAAVGTAENSLTAEFDEDTRRLLATIEEQRERELAVIRERFRAQARRFDEVSEEQLEDLAKLVVKRVIGSTP